MREIIDTEFAWDFFENTGDIESYLLYKEYNNIKLGTETNEYNSDDGAGTENM